jgi:hypothetical protein
VENRPTAAELVIAVADWLRTDAMPALPGALGFQARVAANALGIVVRELEAGPGHFAADRASVAGLAEAEGTDRELLAALSARIRAGALDDRAGEVLEALRPLARHKLEIDNPKHLTTGTAG